MQTFKIYREYLQGNQTQNDLLFPFFRWIETIEFPDQKIKIARLLCQLIPASCPFARDLSFLEYTLHIPPLCKLNPLYDYLMGLRWGALTFLTDVGGKDTDFSC
jgi:hypothetical protein